MALSIGLASISAVAEDDYEPKGPTILDILSDNEGAEALVAAVLVVDESGSPALSLAKALDDPE